MNELKDFKDYFITREGRIFSKRKGELRERKKPIDRYGYERVTLYRDGKAISKRIHRLVAETFISNPENKPCVNHKDGDKTNNHINNLEWATYSENSQHSFDNGLQVPEKGSGRYNSKLNKEKVLFIRTEYEKGNFSQNELASKMGVSRRCIRNVLDRKRWKHI